MLSFVCAVRWAVLGITGTHAGKRCNESPYAEVKCAVCMDGLIVLYSNTAQLIKMLLIQHYFYARCCAVHVCKTKSKQNKRIG